MNLYKAGSLALCRRARLKSHVIAARHKSDAPSHAEQTESTSPPSAQNQSHAQSHDDRPKNLPSVEFQVKLLAFMDASVWKCELNELITNQWMAVGIATTLHFSLRLHPTDKNKN